MTTVDRQPDTGAAHDGPADAARPGVGRVLLLGLAGVFLWLAGDVLLVVFAGLLLAVGIDGMSSWLASRTRLSRAAAFFVVVALLLVLVAGAAVLIVPQVVGQVGDLWGFFINAFESVRTTVQRWGWPDDLLGSDALGQGQMMEAAGAMAARLAGATMATVGAVGAMLVALTIALFAAWDPGLYRRGALALLPAPARQRWDEALSRTGHALRWWFLGQLVSMALLAVTVSLGLWVIGVELWLSLGVLTGLLTFIPILGPLIAGIPILVVAFAEGAQTGLIVLAFYIVVQNLEGNVIVPMIQHRAVNLAPVLLIASQLVLGALFGLLFSSDMAIDLGTANTLVYVRARESS
jgi:predicted PurR-regulated permease PerM